MDLFVMSSEDLIAHLKSEGISKEICDQLKENAIDGETLKILISDIDEFKAVIPKSGHRIQLKMAVTSAGSSAVVIKSKACSEENKENEPDVVDEPDLFDESIQLSPVPVQTPLPSMSIQNNNQELRKAVCVQIQPMAKSQSLSSPKTPNNKPADTCGALPQNLPFPASFSIRVEMAIRNGSVAPERTQLIADVGTFYFGLSSHPRQGDYKRIAILVCEKFPELRDSDQTSYWVSIQKQLSQFFRNLRRRTASKASSGTTPVNESASKKTKLSDEDDVCAQKRNMELLKKAKEGAMSQKTFGRLFDETFRERRKFIENDDTTSATQVLLECPYLGNPKTLRKEVCRIAAKKDWVKDAEGNLTNALKAVLGINDSDYEMSSEQIVKAVDIVEKKTKKNKATTTSLLKFMEPSTMKPDCMFKDKLVQFRLVVVGSPDDVHQQFIAGEDRMFVECDGVDIIQGLIDLIASYYVFDVAYSENMEGSSLFLQDIVFPSKNKSYRGTKYSAFMAKVQQGME